MNRAQSPAMSSSPMLSVVRSAIFAFCAAGFILLPANADEKEGMPDLCQVDQTCLPTATANLLVWFGLHGYPKLIADGDRLGVLLLEAGSTVRATSMDSGVLTAVGAETSTRPKYVPGASPAGFASISAVTGALSDAVAPPLNAASQESPVGSKDFTENGNSPVRRLEIEIDWDWVGEPATLWN